LTDHEQKRKAAVMGVLYFLQEEEKKAALKPQNRWSRFGRETTMKGGIQVQRRTGSRFSLKRT